MSEAMLKIGIENMTVKAGIGMYEWERREGRNFRIDIEVFVNYDFTQSNDSIESTLNYENLLFVVEDKMKTKCNLMESVLNEIYKALLETFPQIEKMRIRISKLNPVREKQIDLIFVEREFSR